MGNKPATDTRKKIAGLSQTIRGKRESRGAETAAKRANHTVLNSCLHGGLKGWTSGQFQKD